MRRPALSYANVMSTLGVFIALGGTSYAVTKLPKNSVGSDQLRVGAVTNGKIADGAITPNKLAPGAAVAGPRGPRGEQGPTGAQGPAGVGVTSEPWQRFDYLNGWGDFASDVERGSFRKDSQGVVTLRGGITRATGAPVGLSVITILPPGYRPLKGRFFGVHTGEPHTLGRIDIHADGRVMWIDGATGGEPDYTSLEGISFESDS